MTIYINKIKCLHCGDIIESKTRYDYKTCSCGKCSVDGGKDYLKRGFPKLPAEEHFEDLSIYDYNDGVEETND